MEMSQLGQDGLLPCRWLRDLCLEKLDDGESRVIDSVLGIVQGISAANVGDIGVHAAVHETLDDFSVAELRRNVESIGITSRLGRGIHV